MTSSQLAFTPDSDNKTSLPLQANQQWHQFSLRQSHYLETESQENLQLHKGSEKNISIVIGNSESKSLQRQ